jgi:hypothetical protein
MPHQVVPPRNQRSSVRPRNRKERIQLVLVIGLILFAILGAFTLRHLGRKSQEYRELNWYSAVATIRDARTQLVSQQNGLYGGAMLYDVQVLAAFSANGSSQERWITVDQPPNNLDYAKFQGRVWKGKQYFVRWKPSDPNWIVIDLH